MRSILEMAGKNTKEWKKGLASIVEKPQQSPRDAIIT